VGFSHAFTKYAEYLLEDILMWSEIASPYVTSVGSSSNGIEQNTAHDST
jgi:hypothetical protein